MITREKMFYPLLLACPSFGTCWDEFLEEYEDEPETAVDGLPYYLALGTLASHLIDKLKQSETSEFTAVFQVVESWHVRGDQYVREAATIGLLEALQGYADEKQQSILLDYWLEPQSKEWWYKLNEFHAGNRSALRE